jgi:putative hemolysin
MRSLLTRLALLSGLTLAACSAGGEDERMPLGNPPPPYQYCVGVGFTIAGSDCVFADGSQCDVWQFFYGECGHANSYCERHGGTVMSTMVDMGTWTGIYAMCSMPGGKSCTDDSFWRTGQCG